MSAVKALILPFKRDGGKTSFIRKVYLNRDGKFYRREAFLLFQLYLLFMKYLLMNIDI